MTSAADGRFTEEQSEGSALAFVLFLVALDELIGDEDAVAHRANRDRGVLLHLDDLLRAKLNVAALAAAVRDQRDRDAISALADLIVSLHQRLGEALHDRHAAGRDR